MQPLPHLNQSVWYDWAHSPTALRQQRDEERMCQVPAWSGHLPILPLAMPIGWLAVTTCQACTMAELAGLVVLVCTVVVVRMCS